MDFCAEWLNQLLFAMDEKCGCKECLFQGCADLDFQRSGIEATLSNYIGNLSGFISMMEKTWGYTVTVSEDGSKLIVDENRDHCVCPIIQNIKGKISPLLCNCSEKFVEKMFSTVCQKQVTVKVIHSVIKDGKSCVFEISSVVSCLQL